jgi:hypothetical protein
MTLRAALKDQFDLLSDYSLAQRIEALLAQPFDMYAVDNYQR